MKVQGKKIKCQICQKKQKSLEKKNVIMLELNWQKIKFINFLKFKSKIRKIILLKIKLKKIKGKKCKHKYIHTL